MTAQDVIDKFREKANKNGINDNISADRFRVILAINEAQNKFVEWVLEKKNEDDIRLIQHLLKEEKLKESNKTENSSYFDLPPDYFDLANLTGKARKDKCLINILLWEVKSQNFNELLNDENNKPSFDYAESFYFVSKNDVRVFKDDFSLENILLTYYRYPKKIDVEGYFTDDGTAQGLASVNIDPEWDDKAMDRIISLAVKDFNINAENLQRFQIDNTRINNKF